MGQGFISLHRCIFDNPIWFEEKFTRAQAWIDLLLLANHETGYIRKRGIRIEINRGEIGRSKETLADRWSWSRNKVTKFLQQLEVEEMIEIVDKSSKLLQKIKITNYDNYQQIEQQNFGEVTQENEGFEQKTGNKRTSKGHQKDTNNNNNKNNNKYKKDTNVSKKETSVSSSPRIDFDLYTAFWNDNLGKYGIPTVRILSNPRKQKIKSRVRNNPQFLEAFKGCISRIMSSDFLKGAKGNWKATFDWVIENDTNYIKILEGNFDGNRAEAIFKQCDDYSARIEQIKRETGYQD